MFCKAEIKRSTFAHNVSEGVAGAYANFASTATFINTTFYGNRAAVDGGAIHHQSGEKPDVDVMTLINTTIAGNSSLGFGGALSSSGLLTLKNTVIANNGGDELCHNRGGTITDGGGNLRWPAADTSCPGTAADPMLAPLGHYGGATETLALLPGSAAIDVGDDSSCAETDQRGVARPQLNHCDSGAYESQGFTLVKLGGDLQATRVQTDFRSPLQVLVVSRHGEPVDGGVIRLEGPSSGAGILPRAKTAKISKGVAATKVRANGISGLYTVRGLVRGGSGQATFHLGNRVW